MQANNAQLPLPRGGSIAQLRRAGQKPAGSAAAAAASLRRGASLRKLGQAARNVLEEVQKERDAPAAAYFTVAPRLREVVAALHGVVDQTVDCVAGLRAIEPDCARVSVDDVLSFVADQRACSAWPRPPHWHWVTSPCDPQRTAGRTPRFRTSCDSAQQ